MEVVFTICSNNYLAHAATLLQSWFLSHPETKAYVILVDKRDESVDYDIILPASLLEISSLNILNFDVLVEQYDITELNTAVKPDVFLYLFKKHPNSKVVYLDPDILVTSRFVDVFDSLNQNDFVLTPHICQPVDDDKAPTDYHTLRTGIFNLGFLALKDTQQVQVFLLWWRHRVFKYGYCNLPANMFYDQLWINYIPVFYEKYFILKHPGYNMANWNLHERILSKSVTGEWFVNDQYELKFFHFSGYKFKQPESIGSYHDRYDFETRPDLKSIFDLYQKKLMSFGVSNLMLIPCVYFEQHKQIKKNKQIAQEAQERVERGNRPMKVKIAVKLASIARKIIYR